jgi:hypothetical protein
MQQIKIAGRLIVSREIKDIIYIKERAVVLDLKSFFRI